MVQCESVEQVRRLDYVVRQCSDEDEVLEPGVELDDDSDTLPDGTDSVESGDFPRKLGELGDMGESGGIQSGNRTDSHMAIDKEDSKDELGMATEQSRSHLGMTAE